MKGALLVRSWLLLVLLALLGATPPEGTPDDPTFRAVASGLRCPTCTGISVLESSAPFSEQIKSAVRDQLAQGKSEAEILAFFESRYGPWILREPPKRGVNLVAWILPLAAMLLGPLVIGGIFWRRPRARVSGVRSTAEILKEFDSLLQEARRAKGRTP